MVHDSHTFERKWLSPRKAPWHYKYRVYTVAIAILMDPNKILVNLLCIILSIRFSLEVEFFFR